MELLRPTDVSMSEWNIIVINHEGKTIEKFLGYCHERHTYRISSQIEVYDSQANTGLTLSGSRYSFLDKPGKLHSDAQAVFDMLESTDGVIVSLKYLPGHQ